MSAKIHGWMLLLGVVLISACAPAPRPTPTVLPAPTQTVSANPSETPSPAPSSSPTVQPSCIDSAVFVADVTIADNTNLQPGRVFTKTWQLRNNGTCSWDAGYSLVYTGGDQMGGPAVVPLVKTRPGDTLNVSVRLTAPSSDGTYTGLYELHDPQGRAVPIGLTKILWVKITVGNVNVAAAPSLPAPTSVAGVLSGANPVAGASPTARPKGGRCLPEQDGNYTAQVLALINTARTTAGLPRLSVNSQLTAAAQAHSDDMACHNLLSHNGSNGSSIHTRLVAAGYPAAYWEEIIFGSGFPQQAFDWWMNDPPHREGILDPKVTEFGAGFSYWADSEYGSYYTVDFGSP